MDHYCPWGHRSVLVLRWPRNTRGHPHSIKETWVLENRWTQLVLLTHEKLGVGVCVQWELSTGHIQGPRVLLLFKSRPVWLLGLQPFAGLPLRLMCDNSTLRFSFTNGTNLAVFIAERGKTLRESFKQQEPIIDSRYGYVKQGPLYVSLLALSSQACI